MPDTRLAHIDGRMKVAELWAQYWLAMATTGVTTGRDISDGTGRQLTDEEKIADALMTASNHIHQLSELVDKKVSILNSRGG